MAGSFEFFRKNQKSMLVAVAILAMLAFFVLPPILQMGGGQASADPVVATWNGGEVREAELDRAVALRTLANRFLMQAAAAAGRDPSRLPTFPEGEELLVREMILAREADQLGMVVSNNAINEFLAVWTNNMVRQNQFDAMIAGLRYGRSPVAAGDLFESLRTALVARNMLLLFQTGFSGDPPGWRWDFYKRLEQAATVEAFPVAVEDFAVSMPAPAEAELRTFFETYKDSLPVARSPDPGFKEPHRIRFASLMAEQKKFEDEAAKTITDADIKEYYEANKETRFRSSKPAATAEPAAAGTDEPSGEEGDSSEPDAPEAATPEADVGQSQGAADASDAPSSSSAGEAAATTTESESPPATDSGAVNRRRLKVMPVVLQAAAGDAESAPAEKPAESGTEPAGEETSVVEPEKTDEETAKSEKDNTEAATETTDSGAAAAAVEMTFQPLEEVADQIRQQLTNERAAARIDAIFSALAADLTAYAEDRAVWLARGQDGATEPVAPDIEKIATKQGLVATQSDWIAAPAAVAAGGIGSSFEFVPDPGSRFGIRQQRWIEMIFGEGGITLRPITSRDAEGNRYFSWKQDDREERVPTFAEARETVEKAWRIVAARPEAEKRAAEIAATAGDSSLQDVVGEVVGEEAAEQVLTVGPFTWLTEGAAGFGAPPQLSSPNGLVMPGEALMRAVFTTATGTGATAFNEPQTFCYALRIIAHEPAEAELQERFSETQGDQRRIAMVAQQAFAEVFTDWIDGLESQAGLAWKRDPRPAR
jgi:hypothetical protein